VVGSLKEVYQNYPHIGRVLPAMGYSEVQIKDLEDTIRRSVCDAVVIATPTDLGKRIRIDQPTVRVSYDFNVNLLPMIDRFIEKRIASPLRQRERRRR